MKRTIFVMLLTVVLLLALAPTGSAHVHLVSQANCAADGVESGALASAHAIEQGRPGPQIPETASEGRTQGQGGVAPAEGTNC